MIEMLRLFHTKNSNIKSEFTDFSNRLMSFEKT